MRTGHGGSPLHHVKDLLHVSIGSRVPCGFVGVALMSVAKMLRTCNAYLLRRVSYHVVDLLNLLKGGRIGGGL